MKTRYRHIHFPGRYQPAAAFCLVGWEIDEIQSRTG